MESMGLLRKKGGYMRGGTGSGIGLCLLRALWLITCDSNEYDSTSTIY